MPLLASRLPSQLFCVLVAGLFSTPALPATAAGKEKSLVVTATAYTSRESETDDQPLIGAWGDRLDRVKPGLRVIAVSPDLLKNGLKRRQRVRIKGLKGEFVILDKMPSRWTKRIDLYMGTDVGAAKRWGKRRVRMIWQEAP